MKKETEWICTDPDNQQWGRKIAPGVYEFKEYNRFYNPDDDNSDDKIIEMTIVLSHYTPEQIWEHVSSYYDSMEQLYGYYGASSEWIIAECIFEQESAQY